MSNKIIHNDILVEIPDFITVQNSEALLNFLKTNDRDDDNFGSPCFPLWWKRISIEPANVTLTDGVTEHTITDLGERATKEAQEFAGRPLYMQMMKGHELPLHSFIPPSKYGTVRGYLILHSDFSGGPIVIPQDNIEIIPNPGSLYLMLDGASHQQGVGKITDGTQYKISFSWTEEGQR